jgi:hypothetical protein
VELLERRLIRTPWRRVLQLVEVVGSTGERRLVGAFAKFRKATMSTVISICLSVRPHRTRLQLDGFSLNLVFEYFSKICREKNSALIKV